METSQSRTHPSASRRMHGFSMLETMISIVILTVGLISLAGLMSKMTGTTHESRYMGTAALLASEKLEELNRYPACDPAVAVNSGKATAGSFDDDVTDTVTSAPGKGCSLTGPVSYFDEVRISAGNGSISETTTGTDESGNVEYTTIKQSPDGKPPVPEISSTPPAPSGDTLVFRRRWVIEKNPPVGPSGAAISGVNRITVLVWLEGSAAGPPVSYRTSMVRQVGEL